MLELVLGKQIEAAIIGVLLVFNAVLGYFQEGRAQATLAALKSRLALNARFAAIMSGPPCWRQAWCQVTW